MTANSFDEGVMVGLLLGGGNSKKEPVIKALSVTENGVYTPPSGVDGYAPVSVLVSDRYDEGYADGYEDGYDDGYQDGYDNGEKDTRDEIANNPDDPTHKEIYDKGKDEGEYTFPEGTEYDDIVNIIGSTDTLTDQTLGYGVSVVENISDDPYTGLTMKEVSVKVVDSDGNIVDGLYGVRADAATDWQVEKTYIFTDGKWEITFSYKDNLSGERKTITYNGYKAILKTFGESGHTFGVSNFK